MYVCKECWKQHFGSFTAKVAKEVENAEKEKIGRLEEEERVENERRAGLPIEER